MKLLPRVLAAIVLAAIGWMSLLGATSSSAPKQADKLVILSTVDVKGKTSPCG
jgi:hypothetical protein